MNDEARAALLTSQTACALIKAMGMLVHDLHAVHHGNGQVYTEESYEAVIVDHGIHWNGAMGMLTGR